MPRRRDFSYRDDADVPDFDDGRPIIVFDGHCIFCSAWVRFVLNQDRQARYRFIAAQTPLGDALYRHFGLDTRDYETNMLLARGRAYVKSEATLRMLTGLGFPWALAGIFRVIPLGLRDAIYGFVARRRLQIAGRRDSCYIPTAAERARFLS